MKRGFLNQPSKKSDSGLLQDQRSTPRQWGCSNPSSGGWGSKSSGGWGSNLNSKRSTGGWGTDSRTGGWGSSTSTKTQNDDLPSASAPTSAAPDPIDAAKASKFVDFPIMKGPILPQCVKQPKQAIQVWYVRNHPQLKTAYRANEYFQTWDFGPPHLRYFTSIYTCPLTGERFLSGTFGDPDSLLVKEEMIRQPQSQRQRQQRHEHNSDADVHNTSTTGDSNMLESELKESKSESNVEPMPEDMLSVCWYRTKKEAENAAAARALDSLTFRAGNGEKYMSYGLCKEEPYLFDENRVFLVPSSAPEEISDEPIMPLSMILLEEEKMEIDDDEEKEPDDSELFRESYRVDRQANSMVE